MMKRKHLWQRCAACAIAAAAILPAASAAPAARSPSPADPYQPLAFLVGHCWKGSFAQGAGTDEHCFSRIYGGRFLRDEHVVHRGGGGSDEFGETIYVWNSATAQLEYLYIESGGGFIRGTATVDGQTLVFSEAAYIEGGKAMNVRSRWQRSGDDAYDVITEFQVQDRWVPGFSLHMQRVRNAPT